MSISFPFREDLSPVLGMVKKPIAKVEIYNKKLRMWVDFTMIVDSGSDYTIIPKHLTDFLNINIKEDTRPVITEGIGGKAKVFLLKKPVRAKIDQFERNITLGVINNIRIPALLGRHAFLETFKVVFEKFTTTFS